MKRESVVFVFLCAVWVIVVQPALAGVTITWGGGGANNLASTAANWVGGVAPQDGDDVVLDGTSSKNMTWDLEVMPKSWLQDGYTGIVTIGTKYGAAGLTNLVITGDCTLLSGTWTHIAQPANAVPQYRLKTAVGGDFTLGASAAIDVNGKGFPQALGPGAPPAVPAAASHGGQGARTTVATAIPDCYGSITEPSDLGSGGRIQHGNAGGGAIWIEVGGVLTIVGNITANGASSSANYSGSGGSIYCRAGAMTGGGSILANGGLVTGQAPGGGGRIALVVTNALADWSCLTGTVEAAGSFKTYGSSSGTIYRETASDSPGKGELIIRGCGSAPSFGAGAQFSGRIPITNSFRRVAIENGGVLIVSTNSMLDARHSELVLMPSNPKGGLYIDGGTLVTPDNFVLTNVLMRVQGYGSRLNANGSFTVGAGADMLLDRPLFLDGDFILSAGRSMTHSANDASGLNKLKLTATGDITIEAGATVNVNGKGYPSATGPGSPGSTLAAASYGGRGAYLSTSTVRSPDCYGSVTAPLDLGSGGHKTHGDAGGGAVWLDAGGALTIDGDITANGKLSAHYSGSGGSIFCRGRTIQGSGDILADGGEVSTSAPGGGGRIALILTGEDADWSGLTGTIRAGGSTNFTSFSSGTIYRELVTDPPGGGELIIRGHGTLPSYGMGAQIGGQVPATSAFSRVVIDNAGVLVVAANSLLDISNSEMIYDPAAGKSGLAIEGGILRTASGFSITNTFLRIQGSVSKIEPGGSLNINSNGELIVDEPFLYEGSLNVTAGGKITRTLLDGANPAGLELHIAGDMGVAAGGAVDVTSKGFAHKQGPGRGGIGGIAASHGGRGGSNVGAAMSRPCYGSIVEPVTCGSGGFYNQGASAGGGALRLNVSGTLRNNGAIVANGEDKSYYTAAGGSVWITAGALTGSGQIEANGGNTSFQTPGGGGRVAVTVTNSGARIADFSGSITAKAGSGGTVAAGAGTVYLRDAGQGLEEGTLVIDNGGVATDERWAEIGPGVEGRAVGSVILRNGGCLRLAENEVLRVSHVWSNAAVGLVAEPGSIVAFDGSTAVAAEVFGSTRFNGLSCETPGKEIKFDVSSKTYIASNGVFRMRGSPASPVVLASNIPGTLWEIDVDPFARQDVEHVAVTDSDASVGFEVTAINSIDNGNNDNWRFLGVAPGARIVWSGNAGTSWGNRGNWDLDRAPVASDVVELPAGCANYPRLDENTTLNTLEIKSGARLELAGRNLTVTNGLAVSGVMIAAAGERIVVRGNASFAAGSYDGVSSTLAFEGSANQTFAGGNNQFGNIMVGKSGGSLQMTDGVKAFEWRAAAAPGDQVTLAFANGKTIAAQRLMLAGDAANPNIALQSTSPGQPWELNVSGYRSVRGVVVSDSNAAGGLPILAGNSTDNGNNSNWVFGASFAEWTGSVNSSFHTAGNWSSGTVPGADTRVVINGGPAVTISQAAVVRDLAIGGDAGATVTVNAALTVVESLALLDNGVMVLNKPGVVSNSFEIIDGGLLTHDANASAEVNKIDLTVLGDVDIAEGGRIDVRAKGYATANGPGASTKQGGGSHGGKGIVLNNGGNTGPCYGSIVAPTALGSGGGWYAGGGAIKLVVAGRLRNAGQILANASAYVQYYDGSNPGYYTGSGGSIFIKTGWLLGNGQIQANGGNSANRTDVSGKYAGGGGRVALIVSRPGADFSEFAGRATAFGGRCDEIDGLLISPQVPIAGAGTVYLRTAAEGDRHGTVIVDNDGGYDVNYVTDLPSDAAVDPKDLRRVNVQVRNGGTLRLVDDATIGDLNLLGINTRLDLNDKTLTIHSRRHSLEPGEVVNEGEIIWLPLDGSVIIVR